MKKSNSSYLITAICACALFTSSQAGALEIQKPNINALKNTMPKASTPKLSTQEIAFQKQFQATVNNARLSLKSTQILADSARWELANVILTKEQVSDLKLKKAQIVANKEISADEKSKQLDIVEDELTKAIKAVFDKKDFNQDFAEYTDVQKVAYKKAATDLQIAHNRYVNITNKFSPNYKKIIDGEASISVVKTELKDSGVITMSVKKESMAVNSLLNDVQKINAKNSIYIAIPETEKVVYSNDGVVGSINYQLNTINSGVEKSYKELIEAFGLKNKIAEEKAKIDNDPNLSEADKRAKLEKVATDTLATELKAKSQANSQGKIAELTTQQRTACINATTNLINAGMEYIALGMVCTKLGFSIAQNPLLAAPLALELGQVKETGKILKENSICLKNVTSQIVKVNKANNIKVEMPKTDKSKTKSVNFKSLVK